MQWVQLHTRDNVAVILDVNGLPAGACLALSSGEAVVAREPVPCGHKVALRDLAPGDPIVKFGHVIGQATSLIAAGQHVHTHNVAMPGDFSALVVDPVAAPISAVSCLPGDLPGFFAGYPRTGGRAGVRNYIVVVASANCSASVVKAITRSFETRAGELAVRQIHGVVPLTHGAGCAQADDGLGTLLLNRTLAGSIFHPNVVAALVVGLGCEKTTADSILSVRSALGMTREIPLRQFTIQDVGGSEAAIRRGIAEVEGLAADLPLFRREPVPVAELALALNCGGSDVFSALSANPVLGHCTDALVARGGTAVLAELPECTGAEQLLRARAVSPAVRQKLRAIFAWWGEYARQHQVSINDNLSHGNVASGLTTIIEKSLGAVTKGGGSPLQQVVEYAEPVTEHGLILMNTPGFDPVSMTGLAAGGCNLAAFTTGRGSVYHCALVPTVKIACTSELFRRMTDNMDFNAGRVLEGGGMNEVAAELYHLLLAVAGGRQTCGERLGIGNEEFVPWAVGETL